MQTQETAVSRRHFLCSLGAGSFTIAAVLSGQAAASLPWRGNTVTAIKGNLRNMIDKVSASDFKEFQGKTFLLVLDENATIEVELLQVESRGGDANRPGQLSERTPFSLVFRIPEEMALVQKMYTMKHKQLGTFQLFLVPIGPFHNETRLEAVFN